MVSKLFSHQNSLKVNPCFLRDNNKLSIVTFKIQMETFLALCAKETDQELNFIKTTFQICIARAFVILPPHLLLPLFFLPFWFLIENVLQPCWQPLGQPLLFLSRFLIACTCDLWLVVLQGFNQACIFKNHFHVSLQVGKMVMEEKCLWCRVMRTAGATLFILRGPFHIRKDPNLQRPGREHVPRTALQTEGTVL